MIERRLCASDVHSRAAARRPHWGTCRRPPLSEWGHLMRKLIGLVVLMVMPMLAEAKGWKATGDMGTARFYQTATLLQDGTVLVAGGHGDAGYLSSAEVYDPASGNWSPTGAMTTVRGGCHTATLLQSGKVLVTGGAYDTGYLERVGLWRFTSVRDALVAFGCLARERPESPRRARGLHH